MAASWVCPPMKMSAQSINHRAIDSSQVFCLLSPNLKDMRRGAPLGLNFQKKKKEKNGPTCGKMWARWPSFQQINAADEATSFRPVGGQDTKTKEGRCRKGSLWTTLATDPKEFSRSERPGNFRGRTQRHWLIDVSIGYTFSSSPLFLRLFCVLISFISEAKKAKDTTQRDTTPGPRNKNFFFFFFGPQQSNLATRSSFIIASLNPFGTVGAAPASADGIFYMPFPPPCVTNNINFIGRLRRPPSLSAASINFIAAAPPSPGLTSIGRVFIFFFSLSLP